MTYDRYIYENCTVRLASVGLAQARPNYTCDAEYKAGEGLLSYYKLMSGSSLEGKAF